MEGDRRRVELMNGLLMSLPGSPIVYYGDEIGMGDNIYLGDRNGVRTPMQWSTDRNAGFSRTEPSQLYSPVITDPVYGYQTVNVEAALRASTSFLHWMRRLIAARKQQAQVFGRGDLRFLQPANIRVLAHLRMFQDRTVLAVHNLAASAEPVELDLAAFHGAIPVEMLGGTRFPAIGERPYFLSLAPHGFYWFELLRPGARPEAYGIEAHAI
jgi:maltose alpha-D-glucosyltransferase/alpha-amylase